MTNPNPNPYPWKELKRKWEIEQITSEQLLGQLLVWGELIHSQLVVCQRQLESRQRQLDDLLARHTEGERRSVTAASAADSPIRNP